ncbi:Thiamine kinase [Limimonas halophila]|uniref:Thiamine kinase n=1 Tax=Limimonas halophila TaxID=1082479 RepID=A0A1G7LLJ9_9PROT|nr:choline kinase family protein [Limimonas halophila]SDF49819.1 Thiamine kinase [Limimonas halophila]
MSIPQEVRSHVSRIPALQGVSEDRITVERLGGLTNLNYLIDADGERFVMRLPGEGTEEYIDRTIEEHNARVAERAGVNAEVVYFDTGDGLMVTRFIEGGDTMSPETFQTRPGAPKRAGEAFRQLHACGESFRFTFEMFSMIDEYLNVLQKENAPLPDGYHDAVKEAEAVREALDANPIALKPCHCDPLTENFIDDGRRMYILDFEYSGMNDPFWDIGDLSVEAGLSAEQDLEMLRAYLGGEPSDGQYGRMVIYKAMSDLLWTLWGLIQYAHGNTVEDFWAYSTERFARCKELMNRPEFSDHVRAVREKR